MLIIDSHVHVGVNWGEPADVLLYQMDANGVSGAVLVAHNGSYDNSYILDCARRHEGRFKVVALVDLNDPNRVKTLESLKKDGASGFRINLRKAETWDPDNSAFVAAGELGMIVSVIGAAENFASARFKKLLDNCPSTHFCLEHLCRAPGADVQKPPYDVYEEALACAKWTNTSVKVPGIGEILGKPHRLPVAFPYEEFPPHYEMAKKAFGIERMMWGSNFPPSAAKEGYRNTLEAMHRVPAFQQESDREWVLGKAAARLWGFDKAA